MGRKGIVAAVVGALVAAGCWAAQASAFVYWTNGTANSIGRANLDGSVATPSFITGANRPDDVAVDAHDIYWSNVGNGTIGRANPDGSGVNQSFIAGASGPTGIAVDGDHIYWANATSNTIGRANLDGSNVNESLITGTGAAQRDRGRRSAPLLGKR